MLAEALLVAVCEWGEAGTHYERAVSNRTLAREAVLRIDAIGHPPPSDLELAALREKSRAEWRRFSYMLGGSSAAEHWRLTAGREMVEAQRSVAAAHELTEPPADLGRRIAHAAETRAVVLNLLEDDHATVETIELALPDLLRRAHQIDSVAGYDRVWRELEVQRLQLRSLVPLLDRQEAALLAELAALESLHQAAITGIPVPAARLDRYRRGNALTSRRGEVGLMRAVIASDRLRIRDAERAISEALSLLAESPYASN